MAALIPEIEINLPSKCVKWTVTAKEKEREKRLCENPADVIVIQNSSVRKRWAQTGWADCFFSLKEERSTGLSEYLRNKVINHTELSCSLHLFRGLIHWISFAEITVFHLAQLIIVSFLLLVSENVWEKSMIVQNTWWKKKALSFFLLYEAFTWQKY